MLCHRAHLAPLQQMLKFHHGFVAKLQLSMFFLGASAKEDLVT